MTYTYTSSIYRQDESVKAIPVRFYRILPYELQHSLFKQIQFDYTTVYVHRQYISTYWIAKNPYYWGSRSGNWLGKYDSTTPRYITLTKPRGVQTSS